MLLLALQMYFIASLLRTEWMEMVELATRRPDALTRLSCSIVRKPVNGMISALLSFSQDMSGTGMPNAVQVIEALLVSVARRWTGSMVTSGGSG